MMLLGKSPLQGFEIVCGEVGEEGEYLMEEREEKGHNIVWYDKLGEVYRFLCFFHLYFLDRNVLCV